MSPGKSFTTLDSSTHLLVMEWKPKMSLKIVPQELSNLQTNRLLPLITWNIFTKAPLGPPAEAENTFTIVVDS